MQGRSFYDVLEAAEDATEQQLKEAYRRQAMQWHPDRHDGAQAKAVAEHRFKEIHEAYRTLREPASRRDYDRALAELRGKQDGARAEHSKARTGERRAAGDSSASDAEKMFYEQMLDLAAELFSRGFPQEAVAKALTSLGCPEAMANAAAASAASTRPTNSRQGKKASGGAEAKESARAKQRTQKAEAPKFRQRQMLSAKPAPRGEQKVAFLLTILVLFAWLLTKYSSGQQGTPAADTSFVSLIQSPVARGRFAAHAIMLFVGGLFGWHVASLARLSVRWRVRAAATSMVALSAAVFSGGYLQARDSAVATQAKPPGAAAATTGLPKPAVEGTSIASKADEAYRVVVARVEAQYPFLNPDSPSFDAPSVQWVESHMAVHQRAGSERIAALVQAISEMEAELKARAARSRAQPAPSASPVNEEAQRSAMTTDERVTISMACNEFQVRGDVVGHRACMSQQTAIAVATPPLPSMGRLSMDDRLTIGMACNDFQVAGDVAGYKTCMRAQLSKVGL